MQVKKVGEADNRALSQARYIPNIILNGKNYTANLDTFRHTTYTCTINPNLGSASYNVLYANASTSLGTYDNGVLTGNYTSLEDTMYVPELGMNATQVDDIANYNSARSRMYMKEWIDDGSSTSYAQIGNYIAEYDSLLTNRDSTETTATSMSIRFNLRDIAKHIDAITSSAARYIRITILAISDYAYDGLVDTGEVPISFAVKNAYGVGTTGYTNIRLLGFQRKSTVMPIGAKLMRGTGNLVVTDQDTGQYADYMNVVIYTTGQYSISTLLDRTSHYITFLPAFIGNCSTVRSYCFNGLCRSPSIMFCFNYN